MNLDDWPEAPHAPAEDDPGAVADINLDLAREAEAWEASSGHALISIAASLRQIAEQNNERAATIDGAAAQVVQRVMDILSADEVGS